MKQIKISSLDFDVDERVDESYMSELQQVKTDMNVMKHSVDKYITEQDEKINNLENENDAILDTTKKSSIVKKGMFATFISSVISAPMTLLNSVKVGIISALNTVSIGMLFVKE